MGKSRGMHYFGEISAQKNHPEGWSKNGAADEARTRYLHLGKDTGIFSPLLYRLSYRGKQQV